MIPIFRSHYSICSSILTLDPADKIDLDAPVSIFSIAKEHKLNEIFLSEKSMSGFVEAFKNAEKSKVALHYGIELMCCANVEDKSETSFPTEHKIIVWLLNTDSYDKFCKLVSFANTEGFYYIPRIDEAHLAEFLDENMQVTIPFYDSFIANNLLTFGECNFDFKKFNPSFFIESSSLPFDEIIATGVRRCADKNEIIPVKSCLYYLKEHVAAYLTMRCMNKRTCWDKPNLDHFSSNEFSFQSYLEQSK